MPSGVSKGPDSICQTSKDKKTKGVKHGEIKNLNIQFGGAYFLEGV